jgi:hypothetical protein
MVLFCCFVAKVDIDIVDNAVERVHVVNRSEFANDVAVIAGNVATLDVSTCENCCCE